jgi:hypothetical protein
MAKTANLKTDPIIEPVVTSDPGDDEAFLYIPDEEPRPVIADSKPI